MKILRIIYEWPPPWDGLAPAPYEMTNAQSKLGHEIDIICGRWPRSGPIEEIDNVTTHPLIREPLNGLLLITIAPFVLVQYLIMRLKYKPDVIHCHGHFAMYIYLYRAFLQKFFKKSKELQVPLVVHFHNTVAGRWEKAKEEGKSLKVLTEYIHWPLAKISDKKAIEVASAYIFVSEELKKDAIKYYGADPNKCFVVESGVNTDLFTKVGQEEKEKTKEDLGIYKADIVITNVGAIVERKNIHVLVESLVHLPYNYRLVLMGREDKDYYDRILDIIGNNNLGKRITRVGYTPYPNLPIAYQGSDLFVLPSSWEGLPKVALESLACGTPVLASGFKSNVDIEGLVYINEIEPKALAQQIIDVLGHPPDVNVNTVQKHFSWDNKASEVEKVYEFVLTGKRESVVVSASKQESQDSATTVVAQTASPLKDTNQPNDVPNFDQLNQQFQSQQDNNVRQDTSDDTTQILSDASTQQPNANQSPQAPTPPQSTTPTVNPDNNQPVTPQS